MRYAMRVGCVWLAVGAVGCAGASTQAPLLEENPVVVSAGQGGAAEIDTGPWASLVRTPQAEQERRHFYERVARELGLEQPWDATGGSGAWGTEAVGGAGRAGGERRTCAEVLASNEPTVVVSGRLDLAVDGLLTLNVPGEGPMKLHVDESTCAVQAHRERPASSLRDGTETEVAYVMVNGLPTARVVRAEPERFLR
ncbi:hypothetical protein [Hyalangium gracile]|uniref:hypothetical protein n=1 Tax=Hyalangium gracile TaxID=394092 RepID=UPI001CC941A4|nr:hypothetical protein [Hyalangium gracile]